MSPERLREVLEWMREMCVDQVTPVFIKVFPIALVSFIVAVALVFLQGRRR